jgi:hypothetical protein
MDLIYLALLLFLSLLPTEDEGRSRERCVMHVALLEFEGSGLAITRFMLGANQFFVIEKKERGTN